METLILILAISAVLFYIMYLRQKKLVDSGQIIKRDSSYMEKAHIFTLTNGDWPRVWEELRTADYHGTCSGTKDSTRPLVLYKGVNWTAELYKCGTVEGEKDTYRFQFTHWETRQGLIQYESDMNTLLTTVEKTFLKIDPQTQVSEQAIDIKTKTKFF